VRLSLKWKIILLAALAVLLPVVAVHMINLEFENKVESTAAEEMELLARLNVGQIAEDMRGLCETSNELLQQHLDHGLEVSREQLRSQGRLRLDNSRKIRWQIVNQFSGNTDTLKLPTMHIGKKPVEKVRSFDSRALIVDKVTDMVGATCTIFQRMNERGDMLRIATTVENSEGDRAIGTYIPAVNPDGKPNPVITTVLSGKTYRGIAYVVNDRYLTAYHAIRNRAGDIVGVIYVGVRLESVESLRKTILGTRVGKTGYVYVLGGKGMNRGHYIISKDGLRDGENLWNARDANGNFFIRKLIDKTLNIPEGEVSYHTYAWKNPGDKHPREKLVATVYFEPWDWVIGAGVYKDDYFETTNKLSAAIEEMKSSQIVFFAIIAFVGIIIAVLIAGRLSRPMGYLAGLARRIASGDIKSVRESLRNKNADDDTDSGDETRILTASFRKMTDNLFSLLSQVQNSGIQVTTSATEISASARQLEATVAEQASSTREVNSAVGNISQTSGELMQTMHDVGDEVDEAADLATRGNETLGQMKSAIDDLSKATVSITSKLSVVSEKANNISAVVTTINKISDRTNLLSLNAAIEAEKAGEYGKGFSVVAREISRLADQTAVATKDIETMVKEMQGSVSSGVMEMDKFGEEVRQGVSKVSTIGSQLNLITDRVRNIKPRFESVEDGMQSQTHGAEQISEAMNQLAHASDQTKESLTEFKRVTEQLNEAVGMLRSEVSKFKIN
jgi:methyl-accepting chemotaxis protein WspA